MFNIGCGAIAWAICYTHRYLEALRCGSWTLALEMRMSNIEYHGLADFYFCFRCWLLELASQSPKTWHLEGLDVSTLNYPATEYLPSNISLKAVDILSDIPENLVGRFDVVHIRTFCIVVKNGDPVPLLRNLLKMLSEFCIRLERPRYFLCSY